MTSKYEWRVWDNPMFPNGEFWDCWKDGRYTGNVSKISTENYIVNIVDQKSKFFHSKSKRFHSMSEAAKYLEENFK